MKIRKETLIFTASAAVWIAAAMFLAGSVSAARQAKRNSIENERLFKKLTPAMERLTSSMVFMSDVETAVLNNETVSPEAWLATLGDGMTPYSTETRTISEYGSFNRIAVDVVWTMIRPEDFSAAVAAAESFFPQIRLSSVTADPVSENGMAKITAVFEAVVPVAPIEEDDLIFLD